MNNTAKMRILVVDDEPLILETLQSTLESIGYDVYTATNGLEALHIVADNQFDMIMMDLRMPIMDGLTAVKHIRQCEKGEIIAAQDSFAIHQGLTSLAKRPRSTIIALSGNSCDREFVLKEGVDEYIRKPFKLERLYDVLDQFCGSELQIRELT